LGYSNRGDVNTGTLSFTDNGTSDEGETAPVTQMSKGGVREKPNIV